MSGIALSQLTARFLAAGLLPGFPGAIPPDTPGWQGGPKKAFSPPPFGWPPAKKTFPREFKYGNQ